MRVTGNNYYNRWMPSGLRQQVPVSTLHICHVIVWMTHWRLWNSTAQTFLKQSDRIVRD